MTPVIASDWSTRARWLQEEERLEAERKAAAELKLRELESRRAQREKEVCRYCRLLLIKFSL